MILATEKEKQTLTETWGLLGECKKAEECYKKALTTTKKIEGREIEASNFINLGSLFHLLGVMDVLWLKVSRTK